MRGNVSSQFLSGLLQAAPYAEKPVEIQVAGTLVSKPYVAMTIAVMRHFGVEVQAAEDLQRFSIARQGYRGRAYAIEPDASAASYFFAAAAISGGRVTVEGLSRDSLQGDVAMVELLRAMGCQVDYQADSITVAGGKLHGITADMNPISDTVQTIAAAALFAEGPTTITGVPHIRHKETDRLHAMAVELRKCGATVEEFSDGLRIEPLAGGVASPGWSGARIETYDDHRMAMSMALVGLRLPGIEILDPGCTAKTYPDFFADLASLGNRPAP